MEKTYTINELSLITGLTTRTLRNYMKLELLKGDKSTGQWLFTDEEISAFIAHPSVKPSIQAKNKGIVYDFLGNNQKKKNEICSIFDLYLEKKEMEELVQKICTYITISGVENIRFSFESHSQHARIILSGSIEPVLHITNMIHM